MTAFLFYFLLFVIDACLWPLKKRHCIRRILKTERQDYSLSLFFKGMVVYCSYMFIRWLQIFIINNKWCYKLCSFILNLMTSMQTDGRTHTRIDIHIKICKHTGTRAHIHTHLFKHTDTYTYTRSHTHTHSRIRGQTQTQIVRKYLSQIITITLRHGGSKVPAEFESDDHEFESPRESSICNLALG